MRPALFRRRQLWVPTPTGWLVLTLLAALLLAIGLRALYPFLAPQAPRGHGLLVIEGWGGERALREAARLWAAGGYERVWTTGGPIGEPFQRERHETWADAAATRLQRLGLPAERVRAVPAPASAQDRTFLSAVMLREALERERWRPAAIDLLSQGPHARRSWRLYRQALGGHGPVGVHTAAPEEYDPAHWWRSSGGTRDVVGEALAWAWTACCFRPPAAGTPDERWGRPEDVPPAAAP